MKVFKTQNGACQDKPQGLLLVEKVHLLPLGPLLQECLNVSPLCPLHHNIIVLLVPKTGVQAGDELGIRLLKDFFLQLQVL